MEALRKVFFENPFNVYVTLAFAELVLAGIWYQRRTPRRAIALLAPLLLAAATALTAHLVVTDREQIAAALKEMAGHVLDANAAALQQYIDEDYQGLVAKDKSGLMVRAAATLRQYRFESIKLKSTEIKVSAKKANAKFTAEVVLTDHVLGGRPIPTDWEFLWVKTDDRWRIRQIKAPQGIYDLR